MAWLRRDKRYDRSRVLAEAARARKRGKLHKAVALYEQVVQAEPRNFEVHKKLAPLLAQTGRGEESWRSYERAARGLVRGGFVEQAIGLLGEASRHLPRQAEVWCALADLELERQRPVDAHRVLLEGRRHMRGRRDLQQAAVLLLRARRLAPRDFETCFDLTGVLASGGAGDRARRMLQELAAWTRGRQLRRVRGRELRMAPSPAALWRWLRAALVGS